MKLKLLCLAIFLSLSALCQVQVHSFTPLSGTAGTLVTINGVGFDMNATGNIVYFGAIRATVNQASATQLAVTVPASATHSRISVTANQRTAFSTKPFNITFNGGAAITTASFTSAANFLSGSNPRGINFSDLDEDGKPDMLITNQAANTLSVYRNISNGTVITFATKVDFPVGPGPFDITTGDLNCDGKTDVAVSNFNSGNTSTVSVFRNASTPGNIVLDQKLELNTGAGSEGLIIANLDNNSQPDLAVVSGNSGWVSIFKNITPVAGGSIQFDAAFNLSGIGRGRILAIDIEEDGNTDLMYTTLSAPSVIVRKNFGGSGFNFGVETHLLAGNFPNSIAPGDIDGDGKTDFVVSNYSSSVFAVIINASTSLGANFQPTFYVPTPATSMNAFVQDMNGDRKPDVIVANQTPGSFSVFQNNSIPGNVSFSAGVEFVVGNGPTMAVGADINGDGVPEIAVTNNFNRVTVLSGNTPLPLTFFGLTGTVHNSNVLMQWKTVNESNVSHFEIEQGTVETRFNKTGQVVANNSLGENLYRFPTKIEKGNFFRIKSVDNDGRFQYSPILKLQLQELSGAIQISPNPARAKTLLKHPSGDAFITIKAINGGVFKTIKVSNGGNETAINTSGLSKGVYMITWQTRQTRLSTYLYIL